MSNIRNKEPSFIERIVLKALSKLTFTTAGLRIDSSGTTLSSVGTVSAVTTATGVCIGRTAVDGQGIQLSYLAFQQGFRRNLVVSS